MLTLTELYKMEMSQLALERDKDPDPDIWRWNPLDIREFDVMLHIANELADAGNIRLRNKSDVLRQLSIAEAGSGIGTKLYLAKNKYGLIEVGYEINDEYLGKSRDLDVHAEKRDLGDADNQPVWAAFDIVYISRPFKDDLRERNWERSVMMGMRPGAILISAFSAVKPYSWECRYRKPFRGVWIKPITPIPDTPVTSGAAAIMLTKVTVG